MVDLITYAVSIPGGSILTINVDAKKVAELIVENLEKTPEFILSLETWSGEVRTTESCVARRLAGGEQRQGGIPGGGRGRATGASPRASAVPRGVDERLIRRPGALAGGNGAGLHSMVQPPHHGAGDAASNRQADPR